MACFDATYLLQLTAPAYDRKRDRAALVGGAWTPDCPENADAQVGQGVRLSDIRPATDMCLAQAPVCFCLLFF